MLIASASIGSSLMLSGESKRPRRRERSSSLRIARASSFQRDVCLCEVTVDPAKFGHIWGNTVSRYVIVEQHRHVDKRSRILTHSAPRCPPDGLLTAQTIRWRRQRHEAAAAQGSYKAGQTGFPWIDASVRCLKQTSWIHHLAR
ncbi:hypothetical protein K437DRAFT_100642 [Tilletiaria anomala UBC 951]|uniref:Cryptochrome/DNA photolyase FAD-binding domain-containing protein n=1 Tax=Tilletiaria anomala (strain ATCC 24038 / CBS 436.72 / UBC 951) TaxID=1037660 RepID=A0A066W063_TILAU|nr:uncharacterized protein K437DRAFT_100642 [Tilletiaria anomala UBC 951]KDN47141.1 hypothetical protein K437DRAFT_100642 [Tilletiaria anomala UBC 951]